MYLMTGAKLAIKYFISLFLLFITQSLVAQDVAFEVITPRVVSVGEPFRLEYTLSGTQNGLNFRAPKLFEGLDILSGPHIFNTRSLRDGNSKISRSFLYIVSAKEKGILFTPIVSIKVGDNQYTTEKIKVKVLAEDENSLQYQYDIDAFLRTEVSRAEIYEDEAVILSCQLFTKVPVLSVKEMEYPILNGFEVGSKPFYDHQDVLIFRQEMYNGAEYNVADLRKITIYPNQTGQFIIPKVEATLSFNKVKLDKNRRGFYPGEIQVRGVDKKLKSEPTIVKVVEMPTKKPKEFSGAIGTFKMRSEVKGSQAKVGELFALQLTVEGYGDLSNSSVPILDLPDEIEIYDVMSDDDVCFDHLRLQSERTFGYLLVAKKAGTYQIPPAKFVYLDVETGNYKTLLSSAHKVSMAKHEIKGSVVAAR